MKIMKTFITPAKSEQLVDKVICDICKAEGSGSSTYDGCDFSSGSYNINSCCIMTKQGESYPDNGNSTTGYFKICPKCFAQHLEPFLESLGARKYVETTDW
jgi:hypothetical protein